MDARETVVLARVEERSSELAFIVDGCWAVYAGRGTDSQEIEETEILARYQEHARLIVSAGLWEKLSTKWSTSHQSQ
jgi:hypothetical protein